VKAGWNSDMNLVSNEDIATSWSRHTSFIVKAVRAGTCLSVYSLGASPVFRTSMVCLPLVKTVRQYLKVKSAHFPMKCAVSFKINCPGETKVVE
jgi:hypothetical protein